jgi:hypothetical protein
MRNPFRLSHPVYIPPPPAITTITTTPSHALFNKLVRDSVVKVRWEVEWFEEGDGEDDQDVNGEGEDMTKGTWILTMARYFIKIANQLLVEEVGFADNQAKGFVMLTADVNVKLRYCHKMKGAEEFDRLIKEGTVQSAPEASEVTMAHSLLPLSLCAAPPYSTACYYVAHRCTNSSHSLSLFLSPSLQSLKEEVEGASNKKGDDRKSRNKDKDVTSGGKGGGDVGGGGNVSAVAVRRLGEMTKGLKDSLSDVLDDREKVCNDRAKMAKAFKVTTHPSNFAPAVLHPVRPCLLDVAAGTHTCFFYCHVPISIKSQ